MLHPVERRTFLRYSLVGSVTAGLGGFGLASLGFLWPRVGEGFGSELGVGDSRELAAEADEENLKVRLESETMTQKSAIASINAQYCQAKLQLDADEVLAKQGLVADLVLKISRVAVEDLANRLRVEQERLAVSSKSTRAQLNAASSRLQQLRALAKLKREQSLDQHRNVDVALMVDHENIAPAGFHVLQPFNPQLDAAYPEDYPGPELVDAVDDLAVRIERTENDGDHGQRDRNRGEDRQLKRIKHEDKYKIISEKPLENCK